MTWTKRTYSKQSKQSLSSLFKMDIKQITSLAAVGEGPFLEFKKKANHPDKIIKELVAFANAKGGKLLLGVDDDGTVSGTRNIEGEVFVLEEAIQSHIRPSLSYEVEIKKLSEKKGNCHIFNCRREKEALLHH